jgi:hypothetical protein
MKLNVQFAFLLLGLLLTRPAAAEEYRLKFIPVSDPKMIITDLLWEESKDTQEPLLQTKAQNDSAPPYFVILHGSFLKKDRTLLFQNRPVEISEDRTFTLKVPVDGEQQEWSMSEIDELGNITQQKSELIFTDWGKLQESTKATKKWSISPGLGSTLATYQQTGVPRITETAITFKVDADYALPGPWSIAGSAYYTPLPITTSQSGMTLQYFSMNIRAVFQVLKPENPWGITINGGLFYMTSFASGRFGYHNLQGIQIYPTFNRILSNHQFAWLYLKYSPIFDGGDYLTFSNAEMAIGGGYSLMTFTNGNTLAVTLDVALLSAQASSSLTVQSNTYTIGAIYRY